MGLYALIYSSYSLPPKSIHQGNPPTKSIYEAVKTGQYKEVERWIKKDKKLVNDSTLDASEFSTSIARSFLSPLDYAFIGNHIEIAKLLIENGATVSEDLLHQYKLSEEMKALLKNVIYTKLRDPALSSNPSTKSIHEAVKTGQYKEVELWIKKDKKLVNDLILDISSTRSHFLSPLDYAVIGNHIEIAKLLIENGATVREELLHQYKLSEEMKALLKNVIGNPSNHGLYGTATSLKNVVDDANVKDTKFEKPPYYGLGASLSFKRAVGDAFDGDDEKIQYFDEWIKRDPSSLASREILHFAVQHSHSKVVKILLKNGAKTQDENIFVEAMYSSFFQPQDILEKLKILYEYGYGKNEKIRSEALLYILIKEQKLNEKIRLAIVEYILDLGIDWNYISRNDPTLNWNARPIMEIILDFKNIKIMELSFRKGGNVVNTRLSNGRTMLQNIAYNKTITSFESDLLNLLIKYKANPLIRIKTEFGNITAYQIARLYNNFIAEKIKKYTLEKFSFIKEDSIEQQDRQLQELPNRNNTQTSIPAQQQNNLNNNLKFTLKKEIGKGGFATVYKGIWQNVTVAIKQINRSISEETTNEFLKEAKLFEKLKHPNIIQMYDFSIQNGKYLIVMEYMKSGSLYQILHGQTELNWSRRYRFSLDIIKGLSYLHHNAIIHCDLKSLNILINENYSAKLGDFGLAIIKNTAITTSSISTSPVGTPVWMAPELFSSTPNSFASDIYSLGIVLYEIASRKSPWEGIILSSMMSCVQSGQRPAIPQETPNSLAQLIALCWNHDRTQRPTADEALETLEASENEYRI